MEKQVVEKKVRWSISKAMSCVYAAVHESKLRIKETNDYKTAMERLTSLYDLTAVQIWILCIVCERCLEDDDSTNMKNLASELEVPAMSKN